ncbi:MAG: phosphoribosylformylglycinamidine cyclo-ligase [Eubacterium sp.]|nr:phosphoribosylformylglycinamidine cyclo-ligase [Eubacterium sp.]
MEKSYSESYKEAGVDITKGYEAVELMKKHVRKTLVFGDTEDIGGFGGLYGLDKEGIDDPVLVSGTDGVGTKLKIAFMMNKHDTVGIGCVAMCVNDIICTGARPLFFLDYIACGKNDPEKIADIVKGVSEGCLQSYSALIGGETAEMPGFYPEDEYDLAGFSVGVVSRRNILDKNKVEPGDIVIALPSSGLHSNGFSLVRKVLDIENADLSSRPDILGGPTLGETLLTPTRIYVQPVLKLIQRVSVKSIANITGGGFYENIPRSLPDGIGVKMMRNSVRVHPVFSLIQDQGDIPERDMFNTFNMGVGMTCIVSRNQTDRALNLLQAMDLDAYILGEACRIEEGDPKVEII